MARKYASRAVEELRAFLEANLGAAITTVNTDEGISLEIPDVFLKGLHPFGETFPRVEIEFQEGSPDPGSEGYRNDMWQWRCAVNLVHAYKDAEVVNGQEELRQYLTAMLDTIQADITLGDTVMHAEIEDVASSGEISDQGRLVGVTTMVVNVHTHEA